MTPDVEEQRLRRRRAAELRRANTRAAMLAGAGPEPSEDPVIAPVLAGDDWRAVVYARGLSTEQARRHPRVSDQKRILALQGNVCMYCGIPIGTVIGRSVKKSSGYVWRTTVVLRRNWDHFAPYSYIVQNPGANWVLSCHVCNLAKFTQLFETVEDARRAILPIRDERGYESVRHVLSRLATGYQGPVVKGPQKRRTGRRSIRQEEGGQGVNVLVGPNDNDTTEDER